MKKIFPFLVFLIWQVGAKAQIANIVEVKKVMSSGENKGLETVIPNTTIEVVEGITQVKIKTFKSKLIKPSNGSLEYSALGNKIAMYGTYMTDIYYFITQEGNDVRLTMFFYNEGAFVSSSNSGKFNIASNIIREIYNKILFNQIQIKLEVEEKILKSLQSDQKKLYNEEDNAKNKIRRCNESIAESEGEIKKYESKKVTAETSLAELRNKIAAKESEVKPLNKPLVETEIKALEKDIKELENANNKLINALKDKQGSAAHNDMLNAYEKQVNDNNQTLVEKNRRLTEKKAYLKDVILFKENELRDMQKERDKTQNDITDYLNNITNHKNNIEKQKSEIVHQQSILETNKVAGISKKAEIAKQQNVVDNVRHTQDPFR